jgi:hypothetical protein
MSSEARIVGYCRTCGTALGDTAGVTVDGVLYCAEHAPHAGASQTPPPGAPSAPPEPASPYAAGPASPSSRPDVSPGLAFVLGFIPGVGAVYNGQYAKGLVHVIIFGSIISILSTGAARDFEPLFGLMIPTFIFYMAFEAYHTAKKRQGGVAVDEFSGLVHATGRPSQFPAGPVLLIAIGILFLLDNLDILKIGRLMRYWPALLIALGLYLLYERVTEARHDRQ